jgi:DNA polymerase-1
LHKKVQKRLFLIDGYSYLFRAYHSLPPLTDPKGTPVGAVYGFTNMLLKLRNRVEVNNAEEVYMLVVFDAGKDTFRNEIYAEYKANRPEAPEDLKPQFPLVRDAAEALNLEVLDAPGFEADDIIATYAKQAEKEDFDVVIVSSDKDLMQLISDNVNMYDSMRDRIIGIPQVEEKFGVKPDKVLDVLSLMGDSSDNIPGVPGIGPKTAAELVNEYGSFDEIFVNTHNIKQPKRRQAFEENKEQAELSRELVKLRYDVPVDKNLNKYRLKEDNKEKLIEFLRKHGFKSIVAKMEEKYGKSSKPDEISQETEKKIHLKTWKLIESPEELQKWLPALNETRTLSYYFLENGFSISQEDGSACFIPTNNARKQEQKRFI